MRTIKVNYQTQIEQRLLGDKLFVIEAIRDLDEAIERVCEALTEEEQSDPFAEDLCPYFGILWPSSEALAEFLYTRSDLVKNKTVLELGCGLGYPSLVVTHLGCDVLATDFHPDVEEYFNRNCRHSVLECRYQRLNWREEKSLIGVFDVVMGSDVLYESKHPREVAQGLIKFLKPGGLILLSDPGRSYLQQFVDAMKEENYEGKLYPVTVKGSDVFVFVFRSNQYIE